jgi:hypothetical protein
MDTDKTSFVEVGLPEVIACACATGTFCNATRVVSTMATGSDKGHVTPFGVPLGVP